MPRGHASVQLKVVRQRHTPSTPLRISRRSAAPSSRLSKMKRGALVVNSGRGGSVDDAAEDTFPASDPIAFNPDTATDEPPRRYSEEQLTANAKLGWPSDPAEVVLGGDSPVIVRQKLHEAKPMTVDEALYQMELVGHPFYLFIEKSSKQPCAVYHRHGWTYGVIRLDAQVL